ncbi:hypothetical protein [Pseudactinotalea sp. Z1748]
MRTKTTSNVVRMSDWRRGDDEPTPPAGGAAIPKPVRRVRLSRERVAA